MWWEQPTVIVACVAGFVAFVLVVLWIFQKTQASTSIDTAELKGTRATVVTSIPEGGVGEIAYVVRGTRQNAPAHSVDGKAIRSPAEVEVVRVVGSSFIVKCSNNAAEPEGREEPIDLVGTAESDEPGGA